MSTADRPIGQPTYPGFLLTGGRPARPPARPPGYGWETIWPGMVARSSAGRCYTSPGRPPFRFLPQRRLTNISKLNALRRRFVPPARSSPTASAFARTNRFSRGQCKPSRGPAPASTPTSTAAQTGAGPGAARVGGPTFDRIQRLDSCRGCDVGRLHAIRRIARIAY